MKLEIHYEHIFVSDMSFSKLSTFSFQPFGDISIEVTMKNSIISVKPLPIYTDFMKMN